MRFLRERGEGGGGEWIAKPSLAPRSIALVVSIRALDSIIFPCVTDVWCRPSLAHGLVLDELVGVRNMGRVNMSVFAFLKK